MKANLSASMIAMSVVVLAACHRRDETSTRTSAPPRAAGGVVALPPELSQRLALERAGRTSASPSVDEVFAALDKAGVDVVAKKQLFARTLGARFCVGGRSRHDVGVVVCEYESAAAAKRAPAYADKVLPVPGRTLYVNRTTLLSLVRVVDTPESDLEAKRAVEVFTRL